MPSAFTLQAKRVTVGLLTLGAIALMLTVAAWTGVMRQKRVYLRTVDEQCVALIGRLRPVVVSQPAWRCM